MAKQTKKEMKALLKEREADFMYYTYGYKKDKDLIDIEKKISELRERSREIVRKWNEENTPARKACRSEIEALKNAIAYKGELNPKDYNEDVQRAYNLFYRGTSEYRNRKLIWVSDDQQFCLLKNPSSTGYVDRMSGSKSSPSEWFLVDVKEFKGGWSSGDEGVFYYQEGGRWSKKFQALCEEKVQQYVLENLL